MIYTKRYIYSLSLIVSIIIFFLTNFLIFKIQTNYIKFEESQVISSENPIIDESKKEISNKDSSSSTKIKSSESANKNN